MPKPPAPARPAPPAPDPRGPVVQLDLIGASFPALGAVVNEALAADPAPSLLSLSTGEDAHAGHRLGCALRLAEGGPAAIDRWHLRVRAALANHAGVTAAARLPIVVPPPPRA